MQPSCNSERGFTMVELIVASTITLAVMGVAFSTFQNALQLDDMVVQLSDQSQNMRAGTNLLIRDLLQAGRNIPIGGIAIPSGAEAEPIHRPSPTDSDYTFDNQNATTLSAITTGAAMGPTITGSPTDMVTILMDDPFLAPLTLNPSTTAGNVPKLSVDGSSFGVGPSTAWLEGDPEDGVSPIKVGDLMYFLSATGTALQTVTRVESPTVYFDADDPFNLNQRSVAAGSITQILGAAMTVRRILMYTYFIEEETPGVPRLMRALNFFPATALAGVIDDLTLRYDLVDGEANPTDVADLPYDANGVTYSASQIRKVTVRMGVRSEAVSSRTQDYLRSRLATVISIRNLAFVDRYR